MIHLPVVVYDVRCEDLTLRPPWIKTGSHRQFSRWSLFNAPPRFDYMVFREADMATLLGMYLKSNFKGR